MISMNIFSSWRGNPGPGEAAKVPACYTHHWDSPKTSPRLCPVADPRSLKLLGRLLNVQCREALANDFTKPAWALGVGTLSARKGREASLNGVALLSCEAKKAWKLLRMEREQKQVGRRLSSPRKALPAPRPCQQNSKPLILRRVKLRPERRTNRCQITKQLRTGSGTSSGAQSWAPVPKFKKTALRSLGLQGGGWGSGE